MKRLNAELVDSVGEDTVLQVIRNCSVPEILDAQSIGIPVCNVDQAPEALKHEKLWIPISLENPIHISINYRNDQHNILDKGQRPKIDIYNDILWGTLSPKQQEWLNSYRQTQIKTYTFIGSIAATDLYLDPSTRIDNFDKESLKEVNEAFDTMIGEWGGFLCASVSCVRIEETTETFTGAQFGIIDSGEEFEEVKNKNPDELF